MTAKEKADQIKRFRQALIKYGIIPFLMALKRLENEEQYELCQIAIDTIKRANLHCNFTIETKIENTSFQLLNHSNDIDKIIIEEHQQRAVQCYENLMFKPVRCYTERDHTQDCIRYFVDAIITSNPHKFK